MPVRETPASGKSEKNSSNYALSIQSTIYLDLKKREATVKKEIEKSATLIKSTFEQTDFNSVGEHREIVVLAPDGKTKILIRDQVAVRASTVDNIIACVREKLGDKAENYILREEVLAPNALEQMLMAGDVTAEDLHRWVQEKKVHSLIVREVKNA